MLALNGLAEFLLGPVAAARQWNLQFSAHLPEHYSGDAVLPGDFDQWLFPHFGIELFSIPGFHCGANLQGRRYQQ